MKQWPLDQCAVCGLPFVVGELIAFGGVQWGGIRVEHADPRNCIRRVAIVATAALAANGPRA